MGATARLSRLILGTLVLSGAAGCGGSGGSDIGVAVFRHETSEQVAVDILVTDEVGDPLPYVGIQLVSPLMEPGVGEDIEDLIHGEMFLQATTDPAGRVIGTATVPTQWTQLDLIVHKSGFRGDYTYESFRTEWGPFAPSARVQVSRDTYLTGNIVLTRLDGLIDLLGVRLSLLVCLPPVTFA